MSPQTPSEITRATQAFMDTLVDAQALAASGEFGPQLALLLRRARELLDLVDEQMLRLDREQYADAFGVAAKMRHGLTRLSEAAATDSGGTATL